MSSSSSLISTLLHSHVNLEWCDKIKLSNLLQGVKESDRRTQGENGIQHSRVVRKSRLTDYLRLLTETKVESGDVSKQKWNLC